MFAVLRAYLKLIEFEFLLSRRNFSSLYRRVRDYRCEINPHSSAEDLGLVCAAVNTACIWYWKEVMCLQRSAVTTCLLRDRGVPATMVIGVQQLPFRAHAWVEVSESVVNDKPYVREMYRILETC